MSPELATKPSLKELAAAVRSGQRRLGNASAELRSAVLRRLGALLEERQAEILDANRRDLDAAREIDLSGPLLGRLSLSPAKLTTLREGIEQLIDGEDPIGKVVRATELDEEPWKIGASVGEPRYVPLQARIGDYAIFFRRASVEITFEGERYLVVPQAAILTLVREEEEEPDDVLPY